MTTREITMENLIELARDFGYLCGDIVRGKGVKIIKLPKYVGYLSKKMDENKKREILNELSLNVDNIFITEANMVDGKRFRFDYKEVKSSEDVFNIKKEIKNEFRDFSSVYFYFKPKVAGYFPIGKYDSSKESQMEMIIDFLSKIRGLTLWGEVNYDYRYDYDNNTILFENSYEGYYYNGDYVLFHGGNFTEGPGNCEYIDGRISNYNESIIEDFWMMPDGYSYRLDELDPEDKVSVYHRKGKDWYVAHSLLGEEFEYCYKDDEGNICDEYSQALFYEEDKECFDKIVKEIQRWKESIERDGYVLNKANDATFIHFHDLLFNQNDYSLLKAYYAKEYDDFVSFYNEMIQKNVKVSDNYLVAIHNMESGKVTHYKQLKKIHRLETVFGYKLVKSDILGAEAFAIKKDGEEYHFNYLEVIYNDESGEKSVTSFIKEALEAIEKRKLEKMNEKELLEKASHVFVGIDDSINSGNCEFGTKQFIARFGINTSKIGGIRGDELLKLQNDNFTKRVVSYALLKRRNHA